MGAAVRRDRGRRSARATGLVALLAGLLILLFGAAPAQAGVLSGVAVQNGSPSAAAGARTQYVVTFTTSATGGLSAASNSRITVGLPTDASFEGYLGGQVVDVTTKRTVGSCASPDGEARIACSLFSREEIRPGDDVRVTLSGVTNPREAGGYAVAVSTTSDDELVYTDFQVDTGRSLLKVGVDNDVPSRGTGARTQYIARFTTSLTGGLSAAANSRITLRFPNDTKFDGYTGGQVFDTTGDRSAGSCSSPVGLTVTCSLFNGIAIGAGHDLRVTLNGVSNPNEPSTGYALNIATTTDLPEAPAPFTVVSGRALSKVTVENAAPSAATGARTQYVVGLTTTQTGGLSSAANSRITMTFPSGTKFDGYTGGQVFDATDLMVVGSCSSPVGLTISCSLFGSQSIAAGHDVRITVNGVTNTGEPSTQHTVGVSTTSDTPTVASSPFAVVNGGEVSKFTASHGAPSPAAGARTRYLGTFTTSATGGLSAAANSRLTVTLPFGTGLAGFTGGRVIDVEANEAVGTCFAAALLVTCSFFGGVEIGAGQQMALELNGITSPGEPGLYSLGLATTSDLPVIGSNAFDVVPGDEVSSVSVELSPSTAAGARAEWVVRFLASKTGGLASGANSRITLGFPSGTTFGGYTGGEVYNATTDESVGSCGSPSGLTITCSFFFGAETGASDEVRITLGGVTNPVEATTYSVDVSTTSDTPPVASEPFGIQPPNELTDVRLTVDSPTPGARTRWTARFSTSETGGLSSDANSRITLEFPAGTGFNAFSGQVWADFGEGDDLRVGSCSSPSGLTVSCSLFGGLAVSPGDAVRVILDGVVNPPGPGPYTYVASTTSDLPPVTSAPMDGPDTVPPGAYIESGPEESSSDVTPTFAFFADEVGSTFQCRFDGQEFAACESPLTSEALGDGQHDFEVRAIDPAGNVGQPVGRTFVVDTTDPNTTIVLGPDPVSADTTPTFSFTSNEAGSWFECRVGDRAFSECESSTTRTLADGSYTFDVRAIDRAGNVDKTPARRSFTIDTSPPQTTIESGPTGAVDDPTPTFTFLASETGSRFECSVDAGGFSACASPLTLQTLADGPHTFRVRAIDSAGNAAPETTRAFTVDTPDAVVSQQPTPTPTPTPPPLPVPTPTPPSLPAPGDTDADGVPNGSDNCPAVPNASQADRDGDRIGDVCDTADASPGPTLAKTVVARVVTGKVFIDPPSGPAPPPLPGVPSGFLPLVGAAVVPLGSVVDTTQGRLTLVSAADARGKIQKADFYDGVFQVKQKRARRPITDLLLRSAAFQRSCKADKSGANAAAGKKPRLWGNGKGRFRTGGKYSSATVRGTIWLTEERCDGTLTRVTKGTVTVRDFRLKKDVTVAAGKRYLARGSG